MLLLQILGGILLAVIILGILVSVLKFIAEPARKLIVGILYLVVFILPVFGLWFAFGLTTALWGVGYWASVLVAAVSIGLFAAWWRFGRAEYLELFREFLEFLQYDVLGLTKTGTASTDESHLHSIFGYGNRSILCDGTGIHYIRFQEYGNGGFTYRTEPHFTTCDTWWTDCRSRQEQTNDGESAIRRKVNELLTRTRIRREKRWIRKTVWCWKDYYGATNAVICHNGRCGRLFILPGEKIVQITRPGQLGQEFYLDPCFFKKVWFHVHVEIGSTPFEGYMFHYECLPEPLKQLFG